MVGVRAGAGVVVGLGTAVLLGVLGLSGPAAGAPVNGTASNGGAVIVVLKNQHDTGQFAALNASREGVVHADQSGVLAQVHAHGGTDVRQLVSVNAVAANLLRERGRRVERDPSVAEIMPDVRVPFLGTPEQPAGRRAVSPKICPPDPAKPFLEPEALTVTHDDQAAGIANGKGVIVAIDGMNDLAGNPNLIRPDGSHVVLDSPTPNANNGNDESFGDASVVAAQGVVTYDYSKELPLAGLPTGCTFQIKGLAPDASLVDAANTDTPGTQAKGELESRIIAGIDNAVRKLHANVISQSFGFDQRGGVNLLFQADDAAVAAGVTVAASSGDSGSSGTVILPASDPNVIAVGATDTLRLRAQADGYGDWVSNNLAALSSGGPAANDKVVDLVAPGDSSAVSCNPAAAQSGCPDQHADRNLPWHQHVRADRGGRGGRRDPGVRGFARWRQAGARTGQADPHRHGDRPRRARRPAGFRAARRVRGGARRPAGPGGSTAASDQPGLIPSASQVDIAGNGGSTTTAKVSLYNAGAKPTTVTGRFRELSQPSQIGKTVTEQITAPAPGTPIPAQGSPAAAPISFTVPGGLAQFNADMIIPDPRNSTDVGVTLFDPKGRLAQISYSYNADFAGAGPAPNDQHVEIQAPQAGTWTAKFFWNANDVPLEDPPAKPGSYRGNMSFHVAGQADVFGASTAPVTIAAHASATVPLAVAFPTAPGDHPESVQFTGNTGARLSVPVSRRTLIPAAGGAFSTTITSTVARDLGQLSSYDVDVPAGKANLDVTFQTADTSKDNTYTYYLVDPSGKVAAQSADNATGKADLSVAYPAAGAGRWTCSST